MATTNRHLTPPQQGNGASKAAARDRAGVEDAVRILLSHIGEDVNR